MRDATGQWSGPRSWAANFRWLMENHPCYIDPDDAIAGRWMFMLSRMRLGYQLSRSNFAFDYSHLEPLQKKYDITTGIGKDAHFAPDYQIGLDLGWGGLLEKVLAMRRKFADDAYAVELMEAEEQAILGVMAWTRHLAAAADERAMTEDDPERRENLVEMARVCCKVAEAKPETFREVVQWIAPHYYQIGGPSADGKDQTSRMSYIILEAANKLKSSCNQTIRVWDGMDR